MILGIGTDIAALARIESLHLRYGERFARRILSQEEMPEFHKHAHPARLLMKRFAAKEALAKAAGTGLRHPVSMTQITVTHDPLGKPTFMFSAELAAYLKKMGVTRHHLSISDEREIAVAFVILEGAN
ncbi:MAG TPA: holo-ACP synthase [Gallionellaceae bacterium]|nr:holo-ACP synthase [Gallionellaceae bacterium]